MAKHAPELMRPETFALGVELNARRWGWKMRHLRGTHPLNEIHRLLTQYWTLPKAKLVSRHQLMKDIIQRGTAYASSKGKSKFSSDKVLTVRALVWQAATRLETEQKRAAELEAKINAPTSNVKVGGHGGNLRFERVANPGSTTIVGADLYQAAQDGALGGIELTGNDVNDLYALRKALKTLSPDDIVNKGYKVLEYADDITREQYALDINKTQFTWSQTGVVVDTVNCTEGDPPGTALYAADLEGDFYCRVYDQTDTNRGWFAHSSFLSGNNALCAGTVKIHYGRLVEISNLSGHYTPKLQNLVDACQAILDAGYRPREDGYALFADFGMEYPDTQRGSGFYRIPLKLFAEKQGKIASPRDFEVVKPSRTNSGVCQYVNGSAALSRGATPDLV